MSEAPTEIRRVDWCEVCAFTRVFRAFRMAYDWKALTLAFLGLFMTYLGGRTLDGMWPSGSQPVVTAAGVNELGVYLDPQSRADTKKWIADAAKQRNSARVGVFSLLLRHSRIVFNRASDGVLDLSPREVLGALYSGAMAKLWVDAINKHGGDAQLVHLPEIGIQGNTHFLMSDLNNVQIADLVSQFLATKKLD